MKNTQTEKGLKELFFANSEDHLLLLFSAQKLKEDNRVEDAKDIEEKALVELGHAKGILEKLIKYLGLEEVWKWYNELSREETKDIKEKFRIVATQYLLSKLLSEKITDKRSELENTAKEKFEEAKKLYEQILEAI
ncbi:MAG: hypothetical protein OWQ54_04640 [Sulfolobaceae archaeon]|nr:hypothetical protein [Sulfolobaceae archaeon]